MAIRKQGSRTEKEQEEQFDVVHEGHLGGCALLGDGATYYPTMWQFMVDKLNIKSMIDVGCGAGYAVDYFKDVGVKAHGVEGCREAIERGLLSPDEVTHHDYENNGPFVPNQEYDLVWSCEFVEHVEERAMYNFFATFKKGKYLAITYAYPGQGGHHHVNEQHANYWIEHLANIGFMYDYFHHWRFHYSWCHQFPKSFHHCYLLRNSSQ